MNRGETIEINGYRAHRFNDSIQVTETANAGKRGKVCRYFSISSFRNDARAVDLIAEQIDDGFGFDDLFAFAQTFDRGGVNEEIGVSVYSRTMKGVEVAPAGFKKIEVEGAHVRISSEIDSFTVRDLDDRNNEPTLIPTCKGAKKTSVKAFRAWVEANLDAIPLMTFSAVWDALQAAGVETHYFCAVD